MFNLGFCLGELGLLILSSEQPAFSCCYFEFLQDAEGYEVLAPPES